MGEGQDSRDRRRVWIGAGVALMVVAALAVLSGLGTGRGTPTSGQNPTGATSAVTQAQAAARRTPGDPLALGSPTAPVVIVEWADFQCPFCGAFARATEPALLAQYVDTGKARVEWRDFAYLGPESTTAAVAARAAGRQGKFWAYHDALYAQQHPENTGVLSSGYLLGLARQLGLDTGRFQADLADPSLVRQVQADRAQGSSLGVVGVPTVLINGRLLFGAQPLPVYQQAIDAALMGATR